MAPKALVGFARVQLKPGEKKGVTVHIGVDELSYWSEFDDDWVVAEGNRTVYVGASSRDIWLEGVTKSGNEHKPGTLRVYEKSPCTIRLAC